MTGSAARSNFDLQRSTFLGTAALFFFALLLGGGGAPAPLMQSVLEALGLFWLLFLTWLHWFRPPPQPAVAWPAVFALLVLLLPALHLVPLPFELWSRLPEREAAAAAVRLSGLGEPAMPLSLQPEGTRQAALQLLPALAVFFGTLSLPHADRLRLAAIAIAVAAISALVAALQLSAPGSPTFYLFPKSVYGLASGLFANRNFQASFLLIGILLCAFEIRRVRAGAGRPPTGAASARNVLMPGLIVLFAVMAIATLSRTALALLVPVLAAAWLIAVHGISRRVAAAVLGAALVVVAILAWLGRGLIGQVLERVAGAQEAEVGRLTFLPDLWYAAERFFPVGSGIGSFDPVFRSIESLALVVPPYFNHAHNDYMEILIEAGLPGAMLVVLFLGAFAVRAVQVLRVRDTSPYRRLQRAALVGIGLLLVHSAADYPLRTITLQCLFAFLAAVLFTPDLPRARRTVEARP